LALQQRCLCFSVSFFLGIELNLLLASVNLSGFQLATGSGPAGGSFAGVPSLLLVPLSMVGVLILGAACFFGSGSTSKTIAALLLFAGGVSARRDTLLTFYKFPAEHWIHGSP
jgi:hypothetical protein